MANLITNRHKNQVHGERPTSFSKRISSRLVRRTAFDGNEGNDRPLPHRPIKHADRKRSGVCPICITRLAKMQKGRVMLIAAITVARSSNRMYVANPVGHIAFGADLRGNDAKAVGSWYPRLDQPVGDLKSQSDVQKLHRSAQSAVLSYVKSTART